MRPGPLSARIALPALLAIAFAPSCNGDFRFDNPSAPDAGACSTDTACKLPSLHCDLHSGQCVECTADSQCPATEPRCDEALHACVQCGVGGDCNPGELCEQKQCVVPCPGGSGCPPSAPVCDPARGFCILCRTGADCARTPATPVCGTNGRCVTCTLDSQCPAPLPYCDLDGDGCVACIPPYLGCIGDQRCDPPTHTCVRQ